MKATGCIYVPAVLILLAAATGCDTNVPEYDTNDPIDVPEDYTDDIPEGFTGYTGKWDESFHVTNYSGDDKESGFMFDTKKIYDRNGNLVMTITDMPGMSSNPNLKHFYETRRYEY
jgi:hypothetical protein